MKPLTILLSDKITLDCIPVWDCSVASECVYRACTFAMYSQSVVFMQLLQSIPMTVITWKSWLETLTPFSSERAVQIPSAIGWIALTHLFQDWATPQSLCSHVLFLNPHWTLSFLLQVVLYWEISLCTMMEQINFKWILVLVPSLYSGWTGLSNTTSLIALWYFR